MSGLDLTQDWQEVKSPLGMEDGTTYVVEFHGPSSTVIYTLDVEGASKPTSHVNALVHFNRDQNPRAEDAMEFQARAGWTWWIRTGGGESRIVIAEV